MPKYYDSSGARRPLVVGPRGIEKETAKSRWDLYPSKIFNSESKEKQKKND